MTAASRAEQPNRHHLAFLVQLVILFVVTAGLAFLIERFALHESTRSSVAFAVSIAMVLVAYHVGLHEGRHESDRHAGGSSPPKRRR